MDTNTQSKYKDFWWCLENDAEPLTLSPDAKHPIRCVFTNYHIDRDTVPKGIHVYDIRHRDDTGTPCAIEEWVHFNHYGSLLTREEIKMTHKEDFDRSDIAKKIGGPTHMHTKWRGMGAWTFDDGDVYEILGIKKREAS